MLRSYWKFTRAYIDYIIIFSLILKNHLQHLRNIFDLFHARCVNLISNKSFLDYSLIILLNQRVDSLKMFTFENKIKIIISLQFSDNLRNLKTFLHLIEWLCFSISWYAQWAWFLQKKKTTLFKEVSNIKDSKVTQKRITDKQFYESMNKELEAFSDLKNVFSVSTFLAHFDSKRQLYIDLDAFKAWDFAFMIYHVKNFIVDNTKLISRTFVELILFLSRMLNTAETNYWSTELKVADIVWIIKRVRHLIDFTDVSLIIIYIDHSTAISISRQTSLFTSSINKLNLRLMRVSQYFLSFNIVIRHKVNKTNVVSDALFRLKINIALDTLNETRILDVLYEHSVEILSLINVEFQLVFHVTLMKMKNEFKTRLKNEYETDNHWNDILKMIKNAEEWDEQLVNIKFKHRNELLYYINSNDERERLCISIAMKKKIFQMTHDNHHHVNFHRSYDRISRSSYIKHLSRRLKTYITHCSECNLNQTKHHRLYESLQLIISLLISHHIIIMNFIVTLFVTKNGLNSLLMITCKFSKRILLLSEKMMNIVKNWVLCLISVLMIHEWDISCVIISDRDFKFMSLFWRFMFERLSTTLLTFISYHSQMNEMFKRMNQMIEIIIRFFVTTNSDEDWIIVLFYLQDTTNNFKNQLTKVALNEILYDQTVKDTVDLLHTLDLSFKNYMWLRQMKRDEVDSIMIFANVVMKVRYDKSHKLITIKLDNNVYLWLHHEYEISDVENRKLTLQRVKSFKVLKMILNDLVCRLTLSSIMKIHSIISIAQLKLTLEDQNLYNRVQNNESSFIWKKDNQETLEYEIKRLIRHCTFRNQRQYLIK